MVRSYDVPIFRVNTVIKQEDIVTPLRTLVTKLTEDIDRWCSF